MLRQMIYTQWKWSRMELAVYAVLGFTIPTAAMRIITSTSGATDSVMPINALLVASVGTGIALATLAFICAVTLSVRPWLVDQARAHVFALSLPVRWAEFVRLRFVAGALLLVVPAVAVWFGGALAAFTMPIPATLHAYPTSIAVRFFASALVLYAAVFALQYLGGRRAAKIGAGALVAWAVLELAGQSMCYGSVSERTWNVLTAWPGPFEVVSARWMLIDL